MPDQTTEVPEAAIQAVERSRWERERKRERRPRVPFDERPPCQHPSEDHSREDLEAAAPILTAPLREELEEAKANLRASEDDLARVTENLGTLNDARKAEITRADSAERRLEESQKLVVALEDRWGIRRKEADDLRGRLEEAREALMRLALHYEEVAEKARKDGKDELRAHGENIEQRTIRGESRGIAEKLRCAVATLQDSQVEKDKGHFSIPGTVRCPSRDDSWIFQCECAEGHDGYHVCVTPRRTIKWENLAYVVSLDSQVDGEGEPRFSCSGSEAQWISDERAELEKEKHRIYADHGLLHPDDSPIRRRLEEIGETLRRLDETEWPHEVWIVKTNNGDLSLSLEYVPGAVQASYFNSAQITNRLDRCPDEGHCRFALTPEQPEEPRVEQPPTGFRYVATRGQLAKEPEVEQPEEPTCGCGNWYFDAPCECENKRRCGGTKVIDVAGAHGVDLIRCPGCPDCTEQEAGRASTHAMPLRWEDGDPKLLLRELREVHKLAGGLHIEDPVMAVRRIKDSREACLKQHDEAVAREQDERTHREFAVQKVTELEAERASCLTKEAELLALVAEQAEDEGLWFTARSASSALIQQELRRLHAKIEGAFGDDR